MAVYFLDTSAVVKRYVQETGTAWVQALTEPAAGHIHFLAQISLPEAVSAITRRERGGHSEARGTAIIGCSLRAKFLTVWPDGQKKAPAFPPEPMPPRHFPPGMPGRRNPIYHASSRVITWQPAESC